MKVEHLRRARTLVEPKGIPAAAEGFTMSFSDEPRDGRDVELHWLHTDLCAGNWYAGAVAGRKRCRI